MLSSVDDYIKEKLTHSIHTSERRSFRGCRRRHNWIFREFYYPTTTPKPLEFGVAFHAAMEKAYDPATWLDRVTAIALAKARFVEVCNEQKAKYLEHNFELGDEAEQDYKERIELGLGMLEYYFTKISPVQDQNFTPVAVEIRFEVPLTKDGQQLWCKCDVCWDRLQAWAKNAYPNDFPLIKAVVWPRWKGLPVTYGGRIDMLAQDQFGRYWIYDWKTAAQLTEVGDADYMLLDDQITSYCWALWKLGIDIAGFVYAEIRKAYPIEPEPMKNRRLGRLYSTSKSQPFEYEMYKTTVSENDSSAFEEGLYNEFLDFLKTDGIIYSQRHQIGRTEQELQIAEENLVEEVLDIVDPNLRIYPSPGRWGCRFCAFQGPCLSKNKGEDFQYELGSAFEKRSYHYYEDTPASTETKAAE